MYSCNSNTLYSFSVGVPGCISSSYYKIVKTNLLCPGLMIHHVKNRARNHFYWALQCIHVYFQSSHQFTVFKTNKVLGFSHNAEKRQVQGNFTVMTLESDSSFFYFVCAGRACHRIWCCFANGPVRSGIRWLHVKSSVSSGCSHQRIWRPDGAWLQKTKTGVEQRTIYSLTALLPPHTQTV